MPAKAVPEHSLFYRSHAINGVSWCAVYRRHRALPALLVYPQIVSNRQPQQAAGQQPHKRMDHTAIQRENAALCVATRLHNTPHPI